MTTQTIDATRVKALRTSRKIGRPKLAKMTGLSERQIAQLEGTKAIVAVPTVAVERLAHALRITPLVLTGELDMTEDDLQPVQKHGSSCSCC